MCSVALNLLQHSLQSLFHLTDRDISNEVFLVNRRMFPAPSGGHLQLQSTKSHLVQKWNLERSQVFTILRHIFQSEKSEWSWCK